MILQGVDMPLTNYSPEMIDNDAAQAGMREYATQKRRCVEENGVLRAILKRLKSDGLNTRSIINAVNVSKLDPEEVRNQLRSDLHYMALRNMPVTQSDLFEGQSYETTAKTQEQEQQWEAEDAGYKAGRHGAKIEDAPYPPGTELHVRWLEFWHKGQAAIARELGDNARVAPASRGRPARKQTQETVILREDEAESGTPDSNADSSDSDGQEAPVKRGPGRPRSANPKRPRRARQSENETESVAAE
jgi:hypothetical protein